MLQFGNLLLWHKVVFWTQTDPGMGILIYFINYISFIVKEGTSQVVLVVKNLPTNSGDVRDTGLIPGSGRFPWKRKWQPTPVVLPGNSMTKESGRLHCPWGRKETDMTQRLSMYTPCMRAARLCVVLVREFSLSRWQSTAVEQRSQVTAHSLFLYNPWGKDGFHNFNWLKKKSKDECYFVTHKNDIKFRFHCP